MGARRRWPWGLVLAAALAGSVLVYRATRAELPFDPERWQHPEPGMIRGRSTRQRMLADLLRHPLLGLRRDSLERLLGPAPMVGHFGEWDMAYWLGAGGRSVPLGSEWLAIQFDSTGRVRRYAVLPD